MIVTTYLCGGINGLSDEDCRDWREMAKSLLRTDTLDPMRRDYRGKEADSVNDIVHGDLDDIRRSDFVLVNAIRPSWGTAMEIVYAHQLHKRIVCWTGDARVSPWLRYHSTAIEPALGAAIEHINGMVVSAVRTLPRDPQTGRNFDGYFDDLLPCGCVCFYHGGVGKCAQHA